MCDILDVKGDIICLSNFELGPGSLEW